MQVSILPKSYALRSSSLTIEFLGIEPNILQESPAARLLDYKTVLSGLLKVALQDEVKRGGNNGEDDGERAKGPSPANIFVEALRSLGTSESCDDVWRGGESVSQTSILQLGNIGGDDINAVCHTSKSNAVEDVGSAERGKVVAHSHENQTECSENGHCQKAFCTAPNVHNLGSGDVYCGSHCVCDNVDNIQEGVTLKATGDIAEQTVINRGLHSIDEVQEPDAVEDSCQ
jgi:hypothetical protein